MIEEFVTYLRTNKGYSEGTCTEYRKDLSSWVDYLRNSAGIGRWSEVTRQDVERYVADLVNAGYKPATIKRRVSVIRQAYQFAWLQGWQAENPAKYVSTPKVAETTPRTLDVDAIRATVHDNSVELETRALIAIMCESGMRLSEVRNLKCEDIDLQAGTALVCGKGNKQRTCYLGATSVELLAEIGKRSGRLFTTCERETRRNVHNALERHAAGGYTTPHALRHTFATTMLANGAELTTLSTMMGHSSVRTTERYVHLGTAEQATAHKAAAPRL